jgi:hypothetical protein
VVEKRIDVETDGDIVPLAAVKSGDSDNDTVAVLDTVLDRLLESENGMDKVMFATVMVGEFEEDSVPEKVDEYPWREALSLTVDVAVLVRLPVCNLLTELLTEYSTDGVMLAVSSVLTE